MVNDRRLNIERPIVPATPVQTSSDLGFRGFILEHHRVKQHENIDVTCAQTMLGLHLGEPLKIEVRDDGPFRERLISPGDIVIIPAGMVHSVRTRGSSEFMVMSLSNDLLAQAARLGTERETLNLGINWGFSDPFIREIFASLSAAIAGGRATDRIYGETLVQSLAMHLARSGKRFHSPNGSSTRGLSRAQLERAMEFIHGTPYADITLQAMAQAAGLSSFHFCRMFKASTGLSPHQYVLRRRIGVGTEMLLAKNESISAIALELGFADQSHFTMHFKRVHGVGPAGYRRQHLR